MEDLLIFVPRSTNRLRYIFGLILENILGLPYRFTSDTNLYKSYEGPKFCYNSQAIDEGVFFKSSPLLFEREIVNQELKFIDFKDTKAFFPVYHKQSLLPFDLFAASFYLVSRYEEYLPYVRDNYGRFEADSSFLHEIGMLQKPLINLWAIELKEILLSYFPRLKPQTLTYQFIPTYDIDLAWAYLHKGLYRSLGAYFRDILAGDTTEIIKRTKVLRGKEQDPYDTFQLQIDLQKQYNLRPIYFILFAHYSQFDKNISRRNPAFRRLIRHLGDHASIGIHPSFASATDIEFLKEEIQTLSEVVHSEISCSRQHYLRLKLPTTYQRLIELDITDDYSMGFASQAGFRAGIASKFMFYDLEHDVPTKLCIHPLSVMDGSLKDYMKLDIEAAKEQINKLIQEVKHVNGTFISLWHNESLSDEKRWTGWKEVYIDLIKNAQT